MDNGHFTTDKLKEDQNYKENKIEICSICAWRVTCQKKFSICGKDMRCPDFVKDISIDTEEKSNKENSS